MDHTANAATPVRCVYDVSGPSTEGGGRSVEAALRKASRREGDWVVTLRVYDGVEVVPLNPPFEYVHHGSLRAGRHMGILSVSENRF